MESDASHAEKVLVTGGSGYLATWVIAAALNDGYSVRATLRSMNRKDQVIEAVGQISDRANEIEFHAADLLEDAGWAEAVDGCDYVLHVASPFPPGPPKHPDDLIVPARDGTLRVLEAAFDAGVKRTVVTSSIVAVQPRPDQLDGSLITEELWTDVDYPKFSVYAKSKAIAERAAWDLADERGMRDRLAVVNPGLILGPLTGDDSFSLALIARLLKGEPAIPPLGFSVVDVRDIATLELAAMRTPAAGGQRFLGVSEFIWAEEIAKTLREELGDDARKVPKLKAPKFAVRFLALFDQGLRVIVPDLGVERKYSRARAEAVLGWKPRPVRETVVDCGRSLAAHQSTT